MAQKQRLTAIARSTRPAEEVADVLKQDMPNGDKAKMVKSRQFPIGDGERDMFVIDFEIEGDDDQ